MSNVGYADDDNTGTDRWALRLYIVGQTPRSVTAIVNLKRICEEHLDAVPYDIEVIDLLINPELAENDQIVIIPTLIRLLPEPVRRVFGDLSDTEKVLTGLLI